MIGVLAVGLFSFLATGAHAGVYGVVPGVLSQELLVGEVVEEEFTFRVDDDSDELITFNLESGCEEWVWFTEKSVQVVANGDRYPVPVVIDTTGLDLGTHECHLLLKEVPRAEGPFEVGRTISPKVQIDLLEEHSESYLAVSAKEQEELMEYIVFKEFGSVKVTEDMVAMEGMVENMHELPIKNIPFTYNIKQNGAKIQGGSGTIGDIASAKTMSVVEFEITSDAIEVGRFEIELTINGSTFTRSEKKDGEVIAYVKETTEMIIEKGKYSWFWLTLITGALLGLGIILFRKK